MHYATDVRHARFSQSSIVPSFFCFFLLPMRGSALRFSGAVLDPMPSIPRFRHKSICSFS